MSPTKRIKEKPTRQESIVTILAAALACATLFFSIFVGKDQIETHGWLHGVKLTLTFLTTCCAVALAYLVTKKKKNGKKIETPDSGDK